jgi:hypothetical protein
MLKVRQVHFETFMSRVFNLTEFRLATVDFIGLVIVVGNNIRVRQIVSILS